MAVRILIADDHKIVRDGLKALLESEGDFEVIGEAGTGQDAIRLIRKLEPDVAVVDIGMPELNGIEVTRKMVSAQPQLKVVALTMHADRRFVAGMLHAGAAAYVLKEAAFEELINAIRSVISGQTYLSRAITDVVVDDYRKLIEAGEDGGLQQLSPREREVLQLLAEGKKTAQIADLLHVSVKTVETHRTNTMKKLGLNNIADLTRFAIKEGLIFVDG